MSDGERSKRTKSDTRGTSKAVIVESFYLKGSHIFQNAASAMLRAVRGSVQIPLTGVTTNVEVRIVTRLLEQTQIAEPLIA